MVEKRETGFRFGKYKLDVVESHGKIYLSLRLYNASGRFIKQFLFEPEVREKLAEILLGTENDGPKNVM